MIKIIHFKGLKDLYKEMAVSLAGITPTFAICFLGFGIGKSLQTPAKPFGLPPHIFAAGILSDVFYNIY